MTKRSENGKFAPGNPGGPGRKRKESANTAATTPQETVISADLTIPPPDEISPVFATICHLKKRLFLETFSTCGRIVTACEKSTASPQLHYHWLKTDSEYADAFAIAKEMAIELLEDELWRRAREGVEKPVFQGGVEVGRVREYSDTALIFALKGCAPEKYRDNLKIDQNVTHTVSVESVVRVLEQLRLKARERLGDGGEHDGT